MDKSAIFLDDDDRTRYLGLLEVVVRRVGWRCLAYCLMDNHVHLLVETPEPNLGRGMQRLHGEYAQGFNRRYQRPGHRFGARFGSNRVRTEEQMLTTTRYVALNPVEAGLCDWPAQWRWSSHAAMVGRAPMPRWLAGGRLLDHFSDRGGDPLTRYRQFVEG